MPSSNCPFCALPPERVIDAEDLAIVIRDGFPVAEGHTLVIPRRHVGSFFELTPQEQASILGLLDRAQRQLREQLRVDAFNIGVNDGPAAGQTVPHVHVHLIPRRAGDVPDPRGGVRWVVPAKAAYWND
jgi:diadenosine tetraphosphate (Ap4A) HIT family hydrolase